MLIGAAQTSSQQGRTGQSSNLQFGGRAQPSDAHRGQNSIPLPLLSFVIFVLPLPGALPPTDDVSPENGIRCGAAFVCWATVGS